MRFPVFAGSFYPSSPQRLRADIENMLKSAASVAQRKKRLAVVSPHAGYMYSGQTAAFSFSACSNWDLDGLTAVIIGPNHTGIGTPVSVSFEDWQTPLGVAKCDVELANRLVEESKIAKKDETAHFREHSCEVQIPFLQAVAPHAKILPICMAWQDLKTAQDLAKAIHSAAKKLSREILVIASSDFTHYEPLKYAKLKDMSAISLLQKMDAEGFQSFVDSHNLSICGHGPIAAALLYGISAGAKKCELLKYSHSSEITGEGEEGVSYASLAIF